ncbi:MAG: 5-oxoprolinase subunit PxpA [Ginsengibacter sp.]
MLLCDLNCDMGEGIGNDELLMPYITSANIACGYHAGDTGTMKKTVELCVKYNVAIGAHPSYPDKENFGRIDFIGFKLKPEDLPELIIDQIQQLQKVCTNAGTKLHHVKPHGALYNRAAWDGVVSSFICSSIMEFDSSLILYGLSNSEMGKEAKSYGLKFMNEVFADRTYQDDGSLTPRTHSNALIESTDEGIHQVLMMVNKGKVKTVTGNEISITAETICIHGDGKNAVEFAKALRTLLTPA